MKLSKKEKHFFKLAIPSRLIAFMQPKTVLPLIHLQVGTFHPLASLTWKQCPSPFKYAWSYSPPRTETYDIPSGINDYEYLEKKWYQDISQQLYPRYLGRLNKMACLRELVYIVGEEGIYVSQVQGDFRTWSKLKTPTAFSTITTYRSQLVLVGGVTETGRTKKVWTSKDGRCWEPTLPPLSIERTFPCAVNTKSPECLVVAGGVDSDKSYAIQCTVEVLINGGWMSIAAPLPDLPLQNITFHNGNLFFTTRDGICYCSLASMISSITQPGEQCTWRELQFLRLQHDVHAALTVSSQQQLTLVHSQTIDTYCTATQSWIVVGAIPSFIHQQRNVSHFGSQEREIVTGILSLPTGDWLIVINFHLLVKASLKGKYTVISCSEAQGLRPHPMLIVQVYFKYTAKCLFIRLLICLGFYIVTRLFTKSLH